MSRDGVTWEPVNTHSDDETDNRNLTLGENVDGGAGGYIIAGAQGSFTSADGMSWKRVDLTSPAFAGMEGIEGGTSFSGGFVLSGEATVPSKGCDGPDLNQLVPSVWWSPNGSTWTREVLPNATDGQGADTYVCHFGDHLLIAGEVTSDYTLHEWKSADGRTWSPLPISGPILCPHSDSAFNDPAIVSAATVSSVGDRTLAISSDEIWAVNDNGTVKKLSQTGKLPAGGIGPVIFGPAGLIVPGNDGNTYVGVPVAG
jgi:hypothetical protein